MSTSMPTVRDTKEVGLTIYKKGKELRPGQMGRLILGNLKTGENMGMGCLIEMTARNMKEVSLIIISMEKGPMNGMTSEIS